MNHETQLRVLRVSQSSVRDSLRASPALLVAVALAAGMPQHEAKAWGNNQYEHLGRTVGSEVGRQVGGGNLSSESRIASLVGGMLGSSIGRPYDEQTKEQKRIQQIEAKAREQAIRDAAYEAQRRQIDPGYQRKPNYQGQVRSSQKANSDYESIRMNIERAAYDAYRHQRREHQGEN